MRRGWVCLLPLLLTGCAWQIGGSCLAMGAGAYCRLYDARGRLVSEAHGAEVSAGIAGVLGGAISAAASILPGSGTTTATLPSSVEVRVTDDRE